MRAGRGGRGWDVAVEVAEAPCVRTLPAMSKDRLDSSRE